MKRFPIALTFAAVAMLAAGTSFAQNYQEGYAVQEGGVQINGNVANATAAQYNNNVAQGDYARAFQSIGTVHSGTVVEGNLANATAAAYNNNVADGSDALACQSIGSIGEFSACREAYDGWSRKQY